MLQAPSELLPLASAKVLARQKCFQGGREAGDPVRWDAHVDLLPHGAEHHPQGGDLPGRPVLIRELERNPQQLVEADEDVAPLLHEDSWPCYQEVVHVSQLRDVPLVAEEVADGSRYPAVPVDRPKSPKWEAPVPECEEPAAPWLQDAGVFHQNEHSGDVVTPCSVLLVGLGVISLAEQGFAVGPPAGAKRERV